MVAGCVCQVVDHCGYILIRNVPWLRKRSLKTSGRSCKMSHKIAFTVFAILAIIMYFMTNW